MNAKQIIGLILCMETVHSDTYMRVILTEFFTWLTEEEHHGLRRTEHLPTSQTILSWLWKGHLVTE
jgi:hypothetical protein